MSWRQNGAQKGSPLRNSSIANVNFVGNSFTSSYYLAPDEPGGFRAPFSLQGSYMA